MNPYGVPHLIHCPSFPDDRGIFSVNWSGTIAGEKVEFRQLNTVQSKRNVVRGLHYNVLGTQGKLVFSMMGTHWSVAVDMRRDSPTYGAHRGVYLRSFPLHSAAFWVPPGFAHGVVCLSDVGVLQYLSTTAHEPQHEHSLAVDSDVNVAWPVPVEDLVAKPADLEVKTLDDFWRRYATDTRSFPTS